MYADVRDRGVPVLLHNIDSTKYLLQFLRIVAVVRIKGRFVDGKIQIGLAFLMPFFPRFGLRADVSHAVITQPLQHGRVLVQQVAATAKILGQHDVGVLHPTFVRQHPGVMYRLFLAVPAAYHHRIPDKILAGEPLVGYLLTTPFTTTGDICRTLPLPLTKGVNTKRTLEGNFRSSSLKSISTTKLLPDLSTFRFSKPTAFPAMRMAPSCAPEGIAIPAIHIYNRNLKFFIRHNLISEHIKHTYRQLGRAEIIGMGRLELLAALAALELVVPDVVIPHTERSLQVPMPGQGPLVTGRHTAARIPAFVTMG